MQMDSFSSDQDMEIDKADRRSEKSLHTSAGLQYYPQFGQSKDD
jgi:hypothetical protein